MHEIPYTIHPYFHRDLSWLLFNRRVIQESEDKQHPLLEQCRFLAIASNNADEFFMVRVPGIQSLARMSVNKKDPRTGLSQETILRKLFALQTENLRLQYQRFHELTNQLANAGYVIKKYDQLSSEDKRKMDNQFEHLILPALTPIGIDVYHAFPKIVEKKIHLFVHVKQENREERAIIPLPPLFSRYLKVKDLTQTIFLEDLISQHLQQLFVGWEIINSFFFRITYDKDLEFEEDTEENLFIQMEEYILERSKGLPSRLEISGVEEKKSNEDIHFLSQMLGLKERDIYYHLGPLDLTFFFDYIQEVSKKEPEWCFPPFQPYLEEQLQKEKLYKTLDEQDILLHHPYDSYEPVLSFLEQAANDPTTIAIKQTLYRVAKDSRVIKALKTAAKNGKQVTALVELKARFDEKNNLHWVQELQEAGCYVTYGFQQLKTHSKAILVVKKQGSQIKQYVHIGTGNYNENTANLYTDISFFSSKETYVQDVTSFFNYLSGYRVTPNYKELAVSPEGIRSMLLRKIAETTAYFEQTGKGSIFFKMNSLTDMVIIQSLYQASQKGLPIELVVRGACCLRPGIPNLSETITVKSIVGRFLEHSRIYSFQLEQYECWISSADAMTRNMLLRVEIAAPIKNQPTNTMLKEICQIFSKDYGKAYFLESSGEYKRKEHTPYFSAQAYFLKHPLPRTFSEKVPAKKYPLLSRIKKLWQT